MKEHIVDFFPKRLARVGTKEVWTVEYTGNHGLVRGANLTFPTRAEAEQHGKAQLGAALK